MAIFTGERQWVYPLKASGLFTKLHKASSAILFAFLIVVPWLRWGGDPLLLADVGSRRMYFLGLIFTAGDGIFIMLLALAAAFSLFFFTTIFGRIWCGYFCPQSVFMINFVFPIEEFIEGNRGVRMRRHRDPWAFDNAWRKVAKWAAYLVISVLVSMSFMSFFVRAGELWTGEATSTAYSVVAFFSFIWFWDFAWFREQTCNRVCPYARFQGALTDDDSLVISYDVPRGEPRGKAAKARGGCIDCDKCVVVCPQGIDIRDGYQLECIACGRCVDACTSVMDKLGHPTLVRYSTGHLDQGKEAVSWMRPRVGIYGGLLAALFAGVVYNLAMRAPVEVLVDRAPGNLFIEDDDGYVRNTWFVHLTDCSGAEGQRTFAIAVEGLPPDSQVRSRPVQLISAERKTVPLVVRVPREEARHTMPLTVKVLGQDVVVSHPASFKGPGIGGDR